MTFKVYPNDDPDTAAKKIHEDWKNAGWYSIPKSKTKEERDGKPKPKPNEHIAYKYSKDIPHAEEIQLGNQNVFLQIIDGEPKISTEIDLSEQKNVVIKPHQRSEITPALPYVFQDDIRYIIKQAKKETIHSILSKSKSLWKYFVVAKDNDTITLLAIDQVYSYFQDLFATTHYVMVTGSPGSGKGAILGTMKALGYRVVLASDMSGANLLDITGSVEPCQVTIAEDEFDDIDTDEVKKKMYKVGYDINGVVPRTLDGNTSARGNRYYYAYCYKVFAAENPLESKDLAGLNDRMFRIESIKSRPKFLIKTILDQMQKPVDKQNPKYRDIISKINYLRKLLLVYRLLHHGDIIEEVPLNIDGRAWELTSPQIFLFNSGKLASSETDKPALNEVLKTLSRFLQKKGEMTKKTLEGIVHEALEKEIFPAKTAKTVIDVNGKNITTYTISNEDICNKVRDLVDGVLSTNPNEYAFYSTDYGKITHKRILKICRDRFSAEPDSIGTGDSKTRALTFDKEVVEKIGKIFEVILEIKIIQTDEDEGEAEHDKDEWDIPFSFPSQDCPTENAQNHTQNEGAGTMGRKYSDFGKIRDEDSKKTFIDYISECESDKKESSSDTLFSGNGPISVPTSQGNGSIFKCYHRDCDFTVDNEKEYVKHGVSKHPKNPLLYPSKAEIEHYGLEAQGKEWEI